MFPRPRTFKPARHTLGAVRLIRSFLLLEDDYDVDWEVDRDEQPPAAHPHRTQLRGRGTAAPRRCGGLSQPTHLCLAPIEGLAPAPPGRRPRPTEIQRIHRARTAAPGPACVTARPTGPPLDRPGDHKRLPPTG